MTSWVVVGAKCVCVDSDIPFKPGHEDEIVADPVKGEIYTVGHVEVDEEGRVWISLLELPEDDLFEFFHFRPIITKTQEEDVSMFLELLQKHEEPA